MNKLNQLLSLMKLLEEGSKEEGEKEHNINAKTDFGESYYVIRTYSAGVFYGQIVRKNGKEMTLKNSRRLWKWSGANELSELAMTGVDGSDCNFSVTVPTRYVTEVIEIIPLTNEALKSLNKVKDWVKK